MNSEGGDFKETLMTADERYSRQALFVGIGDRGQSLLEDSSVVIIGCGALGGIHAETLARAGVGCLTIVDRDFVELSNLQRQVTFDENDALERLPKAIAAARHLQRVNSAIRVTPIVADVNFQNIEEILDGADLVLDGTDNFETRFLINDACVKSGRPWVYGAAVGSYGLTMTIVPGKTPCLRCVLEALPEPGSGPTCDTAGVILPIISMIGSIQSSEALKLLTRQAHLCHGSLIRADVWESKWTQLDLSTITNRSNCPACGRSEFEFLNGKGRQVTTTLCGRNAVQIARAGTARLDLKQLAQRLRPLGSVAFNEFLLRFTVDEFEITVFADARGIVRGTTDPALARTIYARYVGS